MINLNPAFYTEKRGISVRRGSADRARINYVDHSGGAAFALIDFENESISRGMMVEDANGWWNIKLPGRPYQIEFPG